MDEQLSNTNLQSAVQDMQLWFMTEVVLYLQIVSQADHLGYFFQMKLTLPQYDVVT